MLGSRFVKKKMIGWICTTRRTVEPCTYHHHSDIAHSLKSLEVLQRHVKSLLVFRPRIGIFAHSMLNCWQLVRTVVYGVPWLGTVEQPFQTKRIQQALYNSHFDAESLFLADLR